MLEVRKLWFQRKGIETVIGGLIVLVVLLFSLIAMVVLTKQYDAYQSLAAEMQVKDTDRYSENLQVVYPGLSPLAQVGPTSCGGGWCNTYEMNLANLGITSQILRIYVNSTQSPGCTATCIIDPESSSSPAPFRFQRSMGYINQGEFLHSIVFWLPWDPSTQSYTLPPECTVGGLSINYDCNSITVVTSRGRVFSFQWPLPPTGTSATGEGAGGTGIFIGPLVYIFKTSLITYTTPQTLSPPIPLGGTPYGYWTIPAGPPLIIYVKLQTDVNVTNDVFLTQQSVLELAEYTSPGNTAHFYVVAPITVRLCSEFAAKDPAKDIICDQTYGYDQTNSIGNDGNPNNLVDYVPCAASPNNYNSQNCPSARYRIPAPTPDQREHNKRGNPVIVAFSEGCAVTSQGNCGPGGGNAGAKSISTSWAGGSVTSYLGLTYVWDDTSTTGSYVYGVTLPFVAACINNPPSIPTCQG